jgi:hypothetical protein
LYFVLVLFIITLTGPNSDPTLTLALTLIFIIDYYLFIIDEFFIINDLTVTSMMDLAYYLLGLDDIL